MGKIALKYPPSLPVPKKTLQQRFDEKVDKTTAPNGCWLWKGRTNWLGYGVLDLSLKRDGKGVEVAHRIAWRLVNGDIPAGLSVLHRCDVRSCARIDHLFLGTQADNVKDTESKGRGNHPKGEDQGASKLTTEQVIAIRKRYRWFKMSCAKLGKIYGVTPQVIFAIIKRKTWRHI